jgi:glutamyl-tRNA(Gln) amidotransferase subunit E
MNAREARTNCEETRRLVNYIPRTEASARTYSELGFRCGLEIHQQLKTEKKLFCRCPAGLYQRKNDYDAEIIRHMRPTLSELGEYDGTALMEFKTRKNITYRLKRQTACTYDIDDTPPFPINREALAIAMEIALLLKTSIVGELHITRKQYLDGSIPTGFQRTAIVGIEGSILLPHKQVRIIQLSIEEDSCREVSDVGHERVYSTDRLGIPLIETVTYPDMLTPDEAARVGQHLRYLVRSTGKVNTGIGAARQDVNVSITGGTRVEIKGVSHIRWIPELTHNEAFRQKALLEIREVLSARVSAPSAWNVRSLALDDNQISDISGLIEQEGTQGKQFVALNLPSFAGILSFFTQPGQTFGDELSDRLKVIACLEKPNMTHSESLTPMITEDGWSILRELLKSGPKDVQLLLWGPLDDIKTAIETIEERCKLAFAGVPNETRKALADGTTLFERVLPGPNRMYPDTDSAPIPISETMIAAARRSLPEDISGQLAKLEAWGVPEDACRTILRRNLFGIVARIIEKVPGDPTFVGKLIAHTMKHLDHAPSPDGSSFDGKGSAERFITLLAYARERGLERDILKVMVPSALMKPQRSFEKILDDIDYHPIPEEELIARIPELREVFERRRTTDRPFACRDWVMGQLRPLALGNIRLAKLAQAIERGEG